MKTQEARKLSKTKSLEDILWDILWEKIKKACLEGHLSCVIKDTVLKAYSRTKAIDMLRKNGFKVKLKYDKDSNDDMHGQYFQERVIGIEVNWR